MKKIILITLILISGISVYAQEVLSLAECIAIGLEKNYAIRIVRNEQIIADNNVTLGNAGYLPTVDASGSFTGNVNNNNDRTFDGEKVSANGVSNESANLGLNMNWTVFDGFNIQAEYERLQELQRMGELNTRLTIEDFVADLASEYYTLIRQQTRLRNLRSTLELSKERLRIVEQGYYIGLRSRLEFQQAQVDMSADTSAVLNQLEVIHRSRTRLNELMALDNIEEKVILRDTIIRPNMFLDEVDLWKSTLTTNSSLLIAQKNRKLSELDYKKVKSRNYPYVRLNAGYGYTANWYDTGSYELQRRLGLNYGVTVGFNIFDGMNKRREQRNARIEIENKQLRIQDVELALRTDMSNLWMAYQNNLELTALEKENLLIAQDNYQLSIDKYKEGVLSGIELREAQNNLLNAEERFSIAGYNTKLCEISLLQLSGQIMIYLSAQPENVSY